MRVAPALLLLSLPLAAWGQDPGIVVRAGGQEMKVSTLEPGRGEEDVRDFESFILVQMARRGVCLDKLGPDFYNRLHRVVTRAAALNPARFRYFLLLAPRFDDDRVTEIFVVLRDAPEGFPSYIADQVRFFAPMSLAPAVPQGSAEAQDGAAPAPPGSEPPLREAQVSEVAIREYERWLMHCGLFCPGKGLTGDPDGNTVDFKGDHTSWDLEGLMKGWAWDNAKGASR